MKYDELGYDILQNEDIFYIKQKIKYTKKDPVLLYMRILIYFFTLTIILAS